MEWKVNLPLFLYLETTYIKITCLKTTVNSNRSYLLKFTNSEQFEEQIRTGLRALC